MNLKTHFYQIAISNFSSKHVNFEIQIFEKWVLFVKNKNANAILIREWNWNNNEKLHALDIIHKYNLIPILHSPETENPYKFYHWNSQYIYQKPKTGGIHGVSCHNLEEVKSAEKNDYHYVFLSPIYPTLSHSDSVPLGINYLKNCIKECTIPIIALGGITHKNQIQEIKNLGAKGFASIHYFEFL